jgi:hypothetical protein
MVALYARNGRIFSELLVLGEKLERGEAPPARDHLEAAFGLGVRRK